MELKALIASRLHSVFDTTESWGKRHQTPFIPSPWNHKYWGSFV